MQPSTQKLKFGVHSYTLLVPCFLIAIKTSELRTASYILWGGEVAGNIMASGILFQNPQIYSERNIYIYV
jgi:hypothetical protein